MAIGLVALDMDGTIIDDGAVSRRVWAAMRALVARGIFVVFCTGRTPLTMGKYTVPAGWPMGPAVTTNGALVLGRDGQVLQQAFLDDAVVAQVCAAWAIGGNFHCVEMPNSLYLLADRGRALALATQYQGQYFDDISQIPPHVSKIVAIDNDGPARLKSLRQDASGLSGAAVTSSFWNNVEILPPGVDKGTGLVCLCAHLGVDLRDVMAVGDNYNDLPMFDAVGYPVVMSNAPEDLLAQFDVHAPPCSADGAAVVMEKLLSETLTGNKE